MVINRERCIVALAPCKKDGLSFHYCQETSASNSKCHICLVIKLNVLFGSNHHIVASFCSRHVSAPENRMNEGLATYPGSIDIYTMSTCATNTMQPVHDGLSQAPTISRDAALRLGATAATPTSSYNKCKS